MRKMLATTAFGLILAVGSAGAAQAHGAVLVAGIVADAVMGVIDSLGDDHQGGAYYPPYYQAPRPNYWYGPPAPVRRVIYYEYAPQPYWVRRGAYGPAAWGYARPYGAW